MARPKKNVEVKEEKKELKRKGRPKKVVDNVKTPTTEEILSRISKAVSNLSTRVTKLEEQVKDINDDLDEICDDLYCDGHCVEETVIETTDNEWEDLLSLIDKKNKANKTEVRINGKRIDTDNELDAAIDELVDVLFNAFGR